MVRMSGAVTNLGESAYAGVLPLFGVHLEHNPSVDTRMNAETPGGRFLVGRLPIYDDAT